MRILLSNDDGIFAPGLLALRQAVEGLGEITVVGPASPQSATGHSITLSEPLTVRRVDLGAGLSGLSIDGRPADCVRLAIRKLLDDPPDLVITGLNAGSNVGVNVFYSGTVAGAAEGAMLGIPAVAMSAVVPGSAGIESFRAPASLCREVLGQLLDCGLASGDLLNVNIPPLADSDGRRVGPTGVTVVGQSTAEIEDYYHLTGAGGDGESFQLSEQYKFTPEQANTDVVRLAEGYVTITPLHVDMTNHDRLATMAKWSWDDQGPAPR